MNKITTNNNFEESVDGRFKVKLKNEETTEIRRENPLWKTENSKPSPLEIVPPTK